MNEAQSPTKQRRLRAASKRVIATRHARALDRGRAAYGQADTFLEALRAGGVKPGEIIETKDGRLFRFVDNFESSNVAFKTASVKRYELKALNKGEQNEYRETRIRAQQPPQATAPAA